MAVTQVPTGALGQVRLEVIETGWSVASNTSSVRVIGQIYTPSGSFYGDANLTVSLWGSFGNWSTGSWNFDSSGGWHTLFDTTYPSVGHNNDGTGAVSVGFGLMSNTGTWGVGGPASTQTNLTLTTIPRATTGSFSGGSTFDAGAPVTISLPRASSTFTHTVTWAFGAKTGTVATGAGVSASWTPALTMLDQIPMATSGRGMITVITYNGSTEIGRRNTDFTLRAPASAAPTVTALSYTDQNPDVVSIVGKPVQTLSTVKVAVTAAGVYGSTIKAKSATIDTASAPEGTAIPLLKSGSLVVVGVATDTRDRTSTMSGTLDVLPYSSPAITAAKAQRCDSGGTPADGGTYLRVDLTAAVSSLVNGTEKNAATIKIATRSSGDQPYTDRQTITPGLAYDSFFVVTGGGIFDTNKSWAVRITVADRFKTSTKDLIVATERVVLDLGQDGIAVGKRWEGQGQIEVGGNVLVWGSIGISGAVNTPKGLLLAASDLPGGSFPRTGTAQTIPHNAWTTLTYGNTGGPFWGALDNHGYAGDITTGIITITRSGTFRIDATTTFKGGTASSTRAIGISINDATPSEGATAYVNSFITLRAGGIYWLSAGDTVRVKAFQDSGAPLDVGYTSYPTTVLIERKSG